MAAHVAGVIHHDGGTLPVYDVRRWLGLPAAEQEAKDLADALALRKQDHVRWMETLRGQVEREERIAVEMDPHRCAFGRWYDTRSISNYLVGCYLDRFDAPHKAIHAVAVRASQLVAKGALEAARQLVCDAARDVLRDVVALFDGVGAVLRDNIHPYVIVCEAAGRGRAGVLVDELCELAPIEEIAGAVPWNSGGASDAFTRAFGRLTIDGRQTDVRVIDLDRFLGVAAPPRASRPGPSAG